MKRTEDNNAVVVYFSETGNTEVIAQSIADELSIQVYEIKPLDEYSTEDLNYSNYNCRANKEQDDDNARPKIKNDLSDVKDSNVIYLGYPIWWGTNPKIIQTFFESYDLSGKTVYLFCTSGGSGIRKSVTKLQNLYPEVNIVSGYKFDAASKTDISDWIKGLKK